MLESIKEHAPSIAVGGSSGIAITVVGYLITSNFFVTPAQLSAMREEITLERMQSQADYVRKDDFKTSIAEMKLDIKETKVNMEQVKDLLLERNDAR